MYEHIQFDKNIIKQPWFRRMEWQHKSLLIWAFLEMDKIGIVELDMEAFCSEWTRGMLTERDVDIDAFVRDVNNDGKERMIPIDHYKRLWFTPTLIFRNGHSSGNRKLSANERDKSIIRYLAQREVTRDWFLDHLMYDERLTIANDLVDKVYNHKDTSADCRRFVQQIADVVGHKIPESRALPERIKANYHNICQYCGDVFEDYDLTIDHVVPTSKGGPDVYWNMLPACDTCNSAQKREKNVFVFMKEKGLEYPTDWTKGLVDTVDKLVKKGLLEYPTQYLVKKKKEKRKKIYTYSQVLSIHANAMDSRKQSDFETCAEMDDKGKPMWVMRGRE